ncbi:MAG: hypothetical protein NVSMB45_00720 [Ginsengibacter sp.]
MEEIDLKKIELELVNIFPEFSSENQQLLESLAKYIDYLVRTDFQKLVVSLYRFDINESKLRSLLETEQDKNAGEIIAGLIISRQKEKIQSRKSNQTSGNSDEERW